ncbi:MAG: methyltransferase domain-containing protein [Candidatus Hydrogenedentes bacterium]|jgi:phospholipid N-methyltransferase|nr:methyltransferase domain-containing protein [Candidatus Hydrogenedentota bacterium]
MHVQHFLKQLVTNVDSIGAVTASSSVLARAIVEHARVREAKFVLEFGPGTGVFTGKIIEALPEESGFFAMEVNSKFVDIVRRRFPSTNVIHDSATEAGRYLQEHGRESCDSIVSGLPFAVFDDELQDAILDEVDRILEPGGIFVTFTYVLAPLTKKGRNIRRKLYERFSSVTVSPIIWRNLPPAFLYCAKI